MKIVVTVKPHARAPSVERIDEHHFRVAVSEPPAEGKANAAVIAVIAEYFQVSKSCVTIVMGKTARDKVIEIQE